MTNSVLSVCGRHDMKQTHSMHILFCFNYVSMSNIHVFHVLQLDFSPVIIHVQVPDVL